MKVSDCAHALSGGKGRVDCSAILMAELPLSRC